MRELHGWHSDRGRHARDAHTPADHPATRAHDSPKHAAHDAPKLRILLDPEFRKAERLKYQQKVEVAEAEYAARHAKPKANDQARTPEQLKPQNQNQNTLLPKPATSPPARSLSEGIRQKANGKSGVGRNAPGCRVQT